MSTLKVNTLEEVTVGGATFYTAKAWVNFNGTGTVAIRADGNVSSITDISVGQYTVNFSTSMIDASFSCPTSAKYPVGTPFLWTEAYTTSGVKCVSYRGDTPAYGDTEIYSVAVLR